MCFLYVIVCKMHQPFYTYSHLFRIDSDFECISLSEFSRILVKDISSFLQTLNRPISFHLIYIVMPVIKKLKFLFHRQFDSYGNKTNSLIRVLQWRKLTEIVCAKTGSEFCNIILDGILQLGILTDINCRPVPSGTIFHSSFNNFFDCSHF